MKKLSLYQPYCYLCKKPSQHFKVHQDCISSNIFFDQVIVFSHYRNPVLKKLLHDGKYYGRKHVYDDFIPSFRVLLQENLDTNECLLTCPPMHFWRKMLRRYNQSEYIVKQLSQEAKIPFDASLLKKVKHTVHQSHLSKQQRETNLQGVFQVTKNTFSHIQGKKIIVVDDVISTGSTLNECAKLLKQNGAKEVIGLIIASD